MDANSPVSLVRPWGLSHFSGWPWNPFSLPFCGVATRGKWILAPVSHKGRKRRRLHVSRELIQCVRHAEFIDDGEVGVPNGRLSLKFTVPTVSWQLMQILSCYALQLCQIDG